MQVQLNSSYVLDDTVSGRDWLDVLNLGFIERLPSL